MTTTTNGRTIPIVTSNNKQKRLYIVVLVVVVVVGIVYFLGTQKNKSGSPVSSGAPVATQISDQDAVKGLVNNFYTALTNQDGKTLFSYMTPPSTTQETANFSWLTGADLGANSFYRVFLRGKILNPVINDTQKVDNTTYVVKVTDQIQTYSNAGTTAGTWSNPQPRNNIIVTVVSLNGKWFIDKFTQSSTTISGNAGTPKYNGFGQ